jgi:hypothetical protein
MRQRAAPLLVGCMRDDAECVDAAAHQRRDRRVDHAVPFELRATGESRGHQRHPVMAAFPGAGVARVAGAVVDHLDGLRRERLLEGGANLAGGGGVRMAVLAG